MSPITMAILGLLAYKAVKHVTGGQAPQSAPVPAPAGGTVTANTQNDGLGVSAACFRAGSAGCLPGVLPAASSAAVLVIS